MFSSTNRSRTLGARSASHRPNWLGPFLGFLIVAVPILFAVIYWWIPTVIRTPRIDKDWCIVDQLAHRSEADTQPGRPRSSDSDEFRWRHQGLSSGCRQLLPAAGDLPRRVQPSAG